MNLADCQPLLKKEYKQEIWHTLLPQLLPGVEIFAAPQNFPLTNDREKEIATARRQFGAATLADGKRIAFYEIDVAVKVDLLRNRVALREIVARCIDEVSAHAVLAFFVQPDKSFYRLTYAAKESRLGEDLKIHTEQTATRRFTYVLGPGETRRTAATRLTGLAGQRDRATLKEVTDAFSVDLLNREFFDTYKAHYQKFCAHLLDGDAPTKVFGLKLKGLDEKGRDLALKPVRDFVKKLLGRLVFLHFLQKKGWLGCPANATNWKNGDANFLRQLFDTAPAADQQQFHSRRLVPLFFETLNKKRKSDLFAITGTRVPYLNGGLFERDFANVEQIDFPPELFRDLLEFFGQYNFTIDENDPDDHEIGIDPEMLGHIFENLLEDNKDKGAFYTPKAIVQYMCQQSLIYYLKQHLGDRPEIETLVRRKDVGDPADKSNWIRQNAKQIEKLLDQVKICDPAIGSGAFPIGLLQEIYWLKLSLDWTLDRAKAKRDIIQHSIYGVDLDAGAVEIARLRFWLALVVEENTPRPLPNLDYKIMQGNSLLESFEGIDLSNLTGKKRQAIQLLGTEQTELGFKAVSTELTVEFAEGKQQEIGKLISEYFDQDDHEKKQHLHRQIDELVLGHIKYNLELHEERTRVVLDNVRKGLKRKQTAARGYQPTKKEAGRIAELEAQLAEVDRKRDELAKLQEKPERPFFLWHLFFQDVFAQSGFDIVIANPPYVRQESIKEQKAALQAEPYECYDGTADLLVYFYECAVKKLRAGGALTFITSNKFYRAGYGEKLRRYLARELTLHRLIDFGDEPVFEALAYASILEGSKAVASDNSIVSAYTWEKQVPLDRIESVVEKRGLTIQQTKLQPDSWRLESSATLHLLEKLRQAGTPLGKYVGERFYNGVKSGHTQAFVVDRETRDRLVKENPSSAKIFKPYLAGRDLKRWCVQSRELWLMYIPWHFPLHNDSSITTASQKAEEEFRRRYPAVYKHLEHFKDELAQRDKAETGIRYEWYAMARPRFETHEAFEQPKIILGIFMNKPTYAYDTEGFYLNNAQHFIGGVTPFLAAILNSSVCWWFLTHICTDLQNGYLQALIEYQVQIPIPAASSSQQDELTGMVERVIAAKRAGNEALVQSLEREMDAIVFRLYALTPEEIALAQSATAIPTAPKSASPDHDKSEHKAVSPYFTTAARTTLYDRVLSELKTASPYFTTEAIKQQTQALDPEINSASLAVYLTEATANGLIHDAGRGWYSSLSNAFELDARPVKALVTRLEKKFPLLEFTCWSTEQVRAYGHHLLARFVPFIHVERDAIPSVAEFLLDAGYDVHANPRAEAARQFTIREKTVVIRPKHSAQPHTGHQVTIEGLLVELFVESHALNLMDARECYRIFANLAGQSRISMATLLDYARERRPVGLEFVGLINAEFIKKSI